MKSFSVLTTLSILVLSSAQEFSWECENVNRLQSVDLDTVTGVWYIIQEVNPRENTTKAPCTRTEATVQQEPDTTFVLWSTSFMLFNYTVIQDTNNAVWQRDVNTLQVMYISADGEYMAAAFCEKGPWLRALILHRSLEVNEDDLSGIRQHLYSNGFDESMPVKTVEIPTCSNIN